MAANSNELVYRNADGVKVVGLTDKQFNLFIGDHETYQCPISHELMVDPVMTMDGHTYDREYITKWLTNNDTSPKTNELLVDKTLVSNHTLRNAIRESLENFQKRLDSETNITSQSLTPNTLEAVELTPLVSESSNKAAYVIPSDTHSSSSSSSSMEPSRSCRSYSSSSSSSSRPPAPMSTYSYSSFSGSMEPGRSYSSSPSSYSGPPDPLTIPSYSPSSSSNSMEPDRAYSSLPVIPEPYIINEKVNHSTPSQESSSVTTTLGGLKNLFTAQFFPEPTPIVSSASDYRFKVLLVGHGGVGKSSLIERFVYKSHYKYSIHDSEFKKMNLNGSIVKFEIMSNSNFDIDFNTYRDVDAIIIAFSVNKDNTYIATSSYLRNIKSFYGKNLRVTLVATKCDWSQEKWMHSAERFRQHCADKRVNLFFTSARIEGNGGFVDQLFESIAMSLIADKMQIAPSGPSKR
jgi:GTPase SAR1 family protein